MEQLLHYVWRHRIYPLQPLQTTDGQPLEVIDPGLPNTHAGPDFFNAKVKLGDTLWAGDVEVHDRASDWLRHGHDRDRAYDRVVLHVVGEADCDVYRTNGERIPQLLLPCPDGVRRRYDELRASDIVPPCHDVLATLPLLKVHAWLSSLLVERLMQKAEAIGQRLERCGRSWEDAFFVTLARNFGFGVNGDAFEAWALRLPLRAVDKHRDNLFQVEAFFFGMAGLLDDLPRWRTSNGVSCACVRAISPTCAWHSWPSCTTMKRGCSRAWWRRSRWKRCGVCSSCARPAFGRTTSTSARSRRIARKRWAWVP